MLLVVDVGNTNITFGVYRDKELVTTFRLMSKTPRTSDEYGVLITELLSKNHLAIDQIKESQWQAWFPISCILSLEESNVM